MGCLHPKIAQSFIFLIKTTRSCLLKLYLFSATQKFIQDFPLGEHFSWRVIWEHRQWLIKCCNVSAVQKAHSSLKWSNLSLPLCSRDLWFNLNMILRNISRIFEARKLHTRLNFTNALPIFPILMKVGRFIQTTNMVSCASFRIHQSIISRGVCNWQGSTFAFPKGSCTGSYYIVTCHHTGTWLSCNHGSVSSTAEI